MKKRSLASCFLFHNSESLPEGNPEGLLRQSQFTFATLLTSLPFPLSFLSLTLPIFPCFSSPPVLETGIWSKGPQPELIGDLSPPLGRELELWFWSGLISGRAEFQSSLLWRPRENTHNATTFTAPPPRLLLLLSTWLPFLP